ncbi:hypothetical protein [Hasllibacter sp. MH4015]|uniref:hypothetical protein n=1 Tax=Hasllibacter sp. MH4015 TaxID=2854029 RepID=UPI001CD48A86|nr:hypothetical protein [Hasllibacter sp. MH4015]
MPNHDIWRGCLWAYGACILAFAALISVGTGPERQILEAMVVNTLFFATFGVVAFLPAAGLAFATNAALRGHIERAYWWHSTVIITGWSVVVLGLFFQSPVGLVWAVGIGIVASPAFWLGAVGRRWSVPLAPLEDPCLP